MKNLKNLGLTAVALMVLIASLVLSGSFRSYAAPADKDVVVVNAAANPVPVYDVDNRARQPFQAEFTIDLPPGAGGENASFAVPSGKRLVIEYASARGFAPSGQSLWFSTVTHLNGEPGKTHYLIAQPQGSSGALDAFVAGQQTRIYADAGSHFVRADRDVAANTAVVHFTISGYMVDVP